MINININELRLYAPLLGRPTIMLDAADEIERLATKLEAAEKDIALKERIIDSLGSMLNAVANERDALQTKVETMERQEPVKIVTSMPRTSGFTMAYFRVDEIPVESKLYTRPSTKGKKE